MLREQEKIRIFKEADIAPQFGPPKWVVWRPLLFERTFDTGDEAIAFVKEFLNRIDQSPTLSTQYRSSALRKTHHYE